MDALGHGFSRVKGVPLGLIVDMDGVLYRGERPMPGLHDFFTLIAQRPFVLLTNNSTLGALDCAEKLGRMGVDVPASAILTVSDATARYLASVVPPGGGAFVLGSGALKMAVASAGLDLVPEGSGADVVVIGLDPSFTYTALAHAVRLVGGGALFVATSFDAVLLTEDGVVPGAGAMVAAVRACVDIVPVCVGKPSAAMFEMAMSLLGAPAGESLVVGDNLASDIAGGAAAGARTALVLSGVTSGEAYAEGGGEVRPDFVFRGLPELSSFLLERWSGSGG
jgi:4-nitrophenyl phosphatase